MSLIAKGAEADLLRVDSWNGLSVVIKRRGAKRYRHPEIDREIRRLRTAREAEIIHRAKSAGVPTPVVYQVSGRDAEIVMEYVEGEKVRDAVPRLGDDELRALFHRIGVLSGRLHRAGIIHGDLTTSNMLLSGGRVVFIDFGLGEVSAEVEKRGVDLHLMHRMLASTHYARQGLLLEAFHAGYREEMGAEAGEALLRVEEIRRRGRYTEKE